MLEATRLGDVFDPDRANVVLVNEKTHAQHVAAEDRRRELAPLDEGDAGLFDQFAQRQVEYLVEGLDAIDVTVVQGGDTQVVVARVFTHHGERGTRHAFNYAQTLGDALDEGGLSRAERARQQHNVAAA